MATKRAPTEEPTMDETIDIASCSKDPNFFLDDGNIILLAESTLFCVHKSMLSLYSEVFQDMFRVFAGRIWSSAAWQSETLYLLVRFKVPTNHKRSVMGLQLFECQTPQVISGTSFVHYTIARQCFVLELSSDYPAQNTYLQLLPKEKHRFLFRCHRSSTITQLKVHDWGAKARRRGTSSLPFSIRSQ